MNDLVEIIATHIPFIATTITHIVFLIFLLLNISDDFEKIKTFVKKMLNFRKHLDRIYFSKKRDKYNKVLSSSDFIKWQFELINKLYSPLIRMKQEQKWNVEFTELDIDGVKHQYESITLKMKKSIFPFSSICDKQYLETKTNICEPTYSDISKQYSKFINQYYRLVKTTIRYPKRLGFMLNEIIYNTQNGEWGVKAHSGTYENNIKQSHVLEYEIYRLYRKIQKKKINISKLEREEILQQLPIRNAIHKRFLKDKDESNILISGKYRESLLSVQVFVLVRNFNGSYDALRIRRSSNVSAKANYLQFIPSGGFESINDCDDFDSQWDNYSLCKVVFREFLEECFGIDEDDKKLTSTNVSSDTIYRNKYIKKLVAMLTNNAEKKQAYMELLGTSMSLVGLRHEFCFILRIDDVDFARELIANYESSSAIHLVGIDNLEAASFWYRNKTPQENILNDLELLHCTSASLFELARKSNLYKEALRMTNYQKKKNKNASLV
ncbi:MAG: hypothetical protein E7062_03570 [Spirochaetaceae bacterium]|nr:hypothetical protein [Spirochaetaceae bacterium]